MKNWLSCVLSLCTLPVLAEPITVRSGDHEDFTRLVVYVRDGANWSVTEIQDQATFMVEGWTEGFDISEVYELISRERLASLTESDSDLNLSFGCDCTVIATELDQGYVSLDIRNKTSRQPRRTPVSSIENTKPKKDPENFDVENYVDWPIVFPQAPEFSALERSINQDNPSPENLFEGGLGKELARSASLEYLQPSGVDLQGAREEQTQSAPRNQRILLAELAERAKFSNAGSFENIEMAGSDDVCPSNGEFSISQWGGDLPFPDQMAVLRGELYSEFDEIDEVAVRDLIRFYVHYGLNVEVAREVENFSDLNGLSQLQELAAIVHSDFGSGIQPVNFSECDEETNFWSYLASPNTGNISQEQVQGHIAVFQLLPHHLRELTADRLITFLVEDGFSTASNIVRNTIKRDQDIDAQLEINNRLDSELDLLSPEQLLKIVERNNLQSPLALVTYLEKLFQSETIVPTEIIELAGAFIHQLDGTDIADRLRSAQVLALAARGETVEAIEKLLAENEEQFKDLVGLKTRLTQKLISMERTSEISRLILAWKEQGSLNILPEIELLAIARFLEGQGLPELALMPIADVDSTESVNQVTARALARFGRSSDATQLIPESSDGLIDARLSELFLSEDPSTAWSLRNRLSGQAAERAAWISGNWADVPSNSDRAEISGLLADTRDPDEESVTPIQDGQTAFLDSKNARRILQDLLK